MEGLAPTITSSTWRRKETRCGGKTLLPTTAHISRRWWGRASSSHGKDARPHHLIALDILSPPITGCTSNLRSLPPISLIGMKCVFRCRRRLLHLQRQPMRRTQNAPACCYRGSGRRSLARKSAPYPMIGVPTARKVPADRWRADHGVPLPEAAPTPPTTRRTSWSACARQQPRAEAMSRSGARDHKRWAMG